MKLSLFAIAVVLAFNASAATRLGSKCGLTDTKDRSWDETKHLDLTRWSDQKIKALPTLTKQQLIIAAKDLSEGPNGFEAGNSLSSAIEAVLFLRDYSEGGDVHVNYYDVEGVAVTEVLFFPGGNQTGRIFKTGSRRIHAENGDETIVCR